MSTIQPAQQILSTCQVQYLGQQLEEKQFEECFQGTTSEEKRKLELRESHLLRLTYNQARLNNQTSRIRLYHAAQRARHKVLLNEQLALDNP